MGLAECNQLTRLTTVVTTLGDKCLDVLSNYVIACSFGYILDEHVKAIRVGKELAVGNCTYQQGSKPANQDCTHCRMKSWTDYRQG
jgi:hypothetical protein